MRLPDKLKDVLSETGLPWDVELGKKHYKVRLAGRLVAIFPKGKAQESDRRALLNTITQVRRAAQEIRNP